ncbi:Ferric siderophore transport system, periplasmic-binding protein TonB [Cystobacter fuscus]|uniref:Ferric siderophore transport system, periplasmic-binding protein TonB n=1 Tax=Cystobacter fuscus TaxID=43 RepID=A0A250JHY6_9BACT|nr:energy transducer TonB [Cystobacter fuscus]ATB43509.1 Ferric siderophore transport system, periplasmic-binding protein TonB [Cystobacter fuscus]
MSQATLSALPPRRSRDWVPMFLLVSLGAHGVGFALLSNVAERPAPDIQRPVELEMVEVIKPPPPPPPPPEQEPPKPPPPKPKAPPPVKVARAEKPPPPPPPDAPPPPPNDAPPPEPAAKPVPLVVGLSLSSTTAAGGFAAPVGNTVYGKTGNTATDPKDVKAYSAPKYVPVYQVDTQPTVASEVKIPYPDEARRAGVEGSVTMSITIDAEGRVVKVVVIKGLGYGLDEAARGALLRFRFKPAIKNGEPVSTEMKYSYTFVLD